MFKTALLGVAVGSVGITKGLGGGVLRSSGLTTSLLQAYYRLPTASTGFLQDYCGITMGSL